MLRSSLPLLLLLLLPLAPVQAEEPAKPAAPAVKPAEERVPRAKPSEVGLSGKALDGIDRVVNARIESKDIAGAVTVVARKGKVAYFKSFGSFKKDSIVRIYSMTKPVTVAAALILVDEGKLKLSDPVSKYIPEAAALRVEGAEKPAAPMTVQHLMQHTAGLTYGLFSNTGVDGLYRKANLLGRDQSLEEMTKKLFALPLMREPGTRWHYSISLDVLGRVIEVAAKQPFEVFLKKRLFDPLGMVDTGFHVPEADAARLVPCYSWQSTVVVDKAETSPFLKKPRFASGGGGLVSTAADFTRFALMLASGGTHEGKRLLSAESVGRMTTNQLPKALVPISFGLAKMEGVGFGLGVSVRVGADTFIYKQRDWGWSGAASTTFFVCPKEDLVVVNLIQRMPFWNGLDRQIRQVVHTAIERTAVPAGPR